MAETNMGRILQKIAELPHSCHHCDYRHVYCGKSDEDILNTYVTCECDKFLLGRCYYCAIRQSGDEESMRSLCNEAYYPGGCINFKAGMGYDEKAYK